MPPPAQRLNKIVPTSTMRLRKISTTRHASGPLHTMLPIMRLRGMRRTPRSDHPRKVQSTLPHHRSIPRNFTMSLFTRLIMRLRHHTRTTSTMITRLRAIMIRKRPRPINNYGGHLKKHVTTRRLNTRLSTHQRKYEIAILLHGRRNFLLRHRANMSLTRSQTILTTIRRSTTLSNILAIRCVMPTITRTSLQLIGSMLIRVPYGRLRPLTLRTPLMSLTKMSRLTTISSQGLMQQISTGRDVVIIRTRLVSSLVLRVCFSTSSGVSIAYYLHFKLIDELKLGIGLCSGH